jgi:hypothetical protein
MDVQISIVGRHGPSSWDGIVEQSPDVACGRPIVLRTPTSAEIELAKGDRVRVLDAHLSAVVDDGGQPIVVTMNAVSEIFRLFRST